MPSNRGFDSRESESRLALVEAAYMLLEEEGYPAITARRIGERAGLKPQLVHYYFRSMEDLVIAVFHRANDPYVLRLDEALSSSRPLHRLWQENCNITEAKRIPEFIALSKRYPGLRELMRETGENFRRFQTEAIERIAAERGLGDPALNPSGLAALMSAVARNIIVERGVGVTLAHEDLCAYVEAVIDRIEPLDAEAEHRDLAEPKR